MFFDSLKEYEGMTPGLSRIKKFLKALGDPHKKLKCVHIAGTNAKGSTAAFTASILKNSGYKTALYTSPHLRRITERIKINGKDISKKTFAAIAEKYLALAEKCKLSYFEYLTAIAFIYFAAQKVDIAVIETGLGGRFDATNVITDPLVAIITSVNIDHAEILGSTIKKIAFEKAGIIKNSKVVCGKLSAQALKVIKCKTNPLVFGKDFTVTYKKQSLRFDYNGLKDNLKNLKISLYGKHQIQNAAVAACAIEVLKSKGFVIKDSNIKKGLAKAQWPARFDVRKINGAQIIIDGAHNPEATDAFISALKDFDDGNIKRTFIFAAMKEKDYTTVIKKIVPYAGKVILPALRNKRAVDTEKLKLVFAKYIPARNIFTVKNVKESLNLIKKREKAAAAGSLYLAGELIQHIRGL
ncbi:bifunctional folylpolyglutamate synthase/dihydrofolate synthase [Endomicrobium proavitum]|uniref:Dihydrofolate synthase/folylpolyglutamate synthase n=1 Tax=Endomicrobium proavitum TaxID=1408281 RepID=A0A0G3WIV4_9BACT|nr:folylpolyglutamate synthase/dihydrofolate synthase family protein [Endomicrobium proavitum]AKL97807.1 Folylpolyglutamate synthetase [Endomicrobium proavitum]